MSKKVARAAKSISGVSIKWGRKIEPVVEGSIQYPTLTPTRVSKIIGGTMKQVEYTFSGIPKEVVFKMSEISVDDVIDIMSAVGIDWKPDPKDLDADYIKFIPRKDGN